MPRDSLDGLMRHWKGSDMHPAVSVIFFTVSSGAGFGFLTLIGLGVPLPSGFLAAFIASALGVGLAVAGLLSSTFHLGHPERALLAFTQWRSSWLSREGVCAVATLSIYGIYALIWMFTGERIVWLGALVSIGAVATVFTTAMIYTQLKTVPQWNSWMTPACYLLFSFASGILLAASFGEWVAFGAYPIASIVLSLTIVAWTMKLFWWQNANRNTLQARGSDTGTATGLGHIGKVKLFERPHSGENYLTREMVHKIGRKHALKLRVIALFLGALVPVIICLILVGLSPSPILFGLAFCSFMAGLFVERWLFFAEAEHAVSLYYD